MPTGLTFVSYSRTDSEFAQRLATDLRAKGAEVWLDQLDIEAGSRWDTAVESALQRSARLLVLLTPKSVGSQNVLDEVSFALDEGKTVLPVLVEACAIPMRMRRLQHVDFTRGYEAGVTRLLTALGVSAPSVPPAAAVSETPPPSPPPPVSATEPEPVANTEPEAFRVTNHERSNVVPLAAVAGGILLAIAVAVWLSSRGSTVATPETPAETTATAAEPLPAATGIASGATEPPAAAPPAARQAARPASQADNGNQDDRLKMAPAGTPGGSGTMIGGLFGGTAPQPAATGDGRDDPGLQALVALTRRLSSREALDPPELEQLAEAHSKACATAPIGSSCSSTATRLVQSTIDTVCGRKIGPAPPFNEQASLKRDIELNKCNSEYMRPLLDRMHKDALDAIKKIKAG